MSAAPGLDKLATSAAETAQAAAEAARRLDDEQRRQLEAQEARYAAWAQRVVDAWDDDLAAADKKIVQTRAAFRQAVVNDRGPAAAYIAMTEAEQARSVLAQRLAQALSSLSLSTFRGAAIPELPSHTRPYSDSVDEVLAAAARDARQDLTDEIEAVLAGDGA